MGAYWSKWECLGKRNTKKPMKRKDGVRMIFFVGEHPRQLDERGRFILPAKIRENLSGTVFITRSPVDECLNLYPQEEWEIISAKVRSLPTVTDRNAAELQRRLFGKAISCEIDKQGRIPLSSELIEYAGMKKDIVLVGVNSKLEIWDSEKWKGVDEAIDTQTVIEGIAKYGINI